MHRILCSTLLVLIPGSWAIGQRTATPSSAITRYLDSEIRAGSVVGAQVLSGEQRSRKDDVISLGRISLEDDRPVTDQTVFCIASCSKPIASALIFSLLDRRKLRLDQSASELIPEMSSLTTADGMTARSPTLRELLAHRGGIYSQFDQPTKLQQSAIRNFRLSIDESVDIIAGQPLSTPPGTKYAYSGAGYMLVGKLAEKASGMQIDAVLQQNICEPLGMTSTTYFPNKQTIDEIADGGKSALMRPHALGKQLRLPLVGGSLYSTAGDLGKFARMVLSQGRAGRNQILSQTAWNHFVSPAFPSQQYGFGWLLTKQSDRVIALSHQGSLPPYQCSIRVDLTKNTYTIAIWTLAKVTDAQATKRIRNRIIALMNN